MKSLHPGESLSVWADQTQMPFTPSLSQDLEVDVCIVGGGLAGLSTAYLLGREGKEVCVLEDCELGSGQTGRTTAHFSTSLDERYFNLEKDHGAQKTRLIAQSHQAALDQVLKIVSDENIDCECSLVDGYLFASPEEEEKILWKELEAAQRAGLGVGLLERSPQRSFDTGVCLHFPKQMQLHPLKYLKGLAECVLRDGGQIYTRTHVAEVSGGGLACVRTRDGFTVRAKSVLMATNTPINNLLAIHTKQVAYRTYVIGARVPHGRVAKGLFWDTHNPYHYFRIQSLDEHSDLLIVGGEDHKTGQNNHPERCYDRLEGWTRLRFPFTEELLYRWSGQVMQSVDGLGFLGHNPLDAENVYVITGDSGTGMTHTTIGALLVTDQIMGRKNPWEALYDPSRVRLRSTGRMVSENVRTVAKYAHWFAGKDVAALEKLPPDEGMVLRNGLGRIAAYRDQHGQIILKSAICTHMGCVVTWNGVEKSWDCPCHGSRFDSHGQVIEGPATRDLAEVDDDDQAVVHEQLTGSSPSFSEGNQLPDFAMSQACRCPRSF